MGEDRGRLYVHPDTPSSGAKWEKQLLTFQKCKITGSACSGKSLKVGAQMGGWAALLGLWLFLNTQRTTIIIGVWHKDHNVIVFQNEEMQSALNIKLKVALFGV